MPRINRRVLIVSLLVVVVAALSVLMLHRYQVGQQSEFFVQQARRAVEEGSLPEAVSFYNRALRMEPNDAEALLELAEILETLGDTRNAFLTSLRAERLKPGDAQNELRLARLAVQLERYADALERINDLLEDGQGNRATLLTLKGDALVGLREFGFGVFSPEEASSNEASDASGTEDVTAASEIAAGDNAISAYRAAIETGEAPIETYIKLATVLTDSVARPQEGLKVLDLLLKQYPQDPDAHVARGRFFLDQTGGLTPSVTTDTSGSLKANLDRAEESATRALELAPESRESLEFAVTVAMQREELRRAMELSQRGIQLFPDSAMFYRVASRAAAKLAEDSSISTAEKEKLMAESQRYLESGIARLPGAVELRWNLANQLLDDKNGDPEAARKHINQLENTNFSKPLQSFLKGKLLAVTGDSKKAIEELEKSRSGLRDSKELLRLVDLTLAAIYEEREQFDEQVSTLRRVVESNPRWLPGHERLAAAYMKLGRLDEAVQQYEVVANRPNGSITAPLNFAWLLYSQNLGRPQESRDWSQFETVLDAMSKDPKRASDVAVLRAKMLLVQGKGDEARSVLQSAPDQAAVWSDRVLLEIDEREWERAEELLNQAVSEIGETPTLRYASARLLVDQGKQDLSEQLAKLATKTPNWSEDQQDDFASLMIPLLVSSGESRLAEEVVDRQREKDPSDLNAQKQKMELVYREYQVKLQEGSENEQSIDPADRDRLVSEMGSVTSDLRQTVGEGALWNCGTALQKVMETESWDLDQETSGEAQKHLSDAARQRPNLDLIPALSGSIYERAGESEKAIEAYQRAISLGWRQTATLQHLLALLTEEKRFAEADGIIRQLLQGGKSVSAEMARYASVVSYRNADMRRALVHAREAASQSKSEGDYLWLARMEELTKHSSEADAAYQNAIQSADDPTSARLAWIGYLNRNARLGEARKALAEAEESAEPSDPGSLINVAKGYLALPDKAEAARVLSAIDLSTLEGIKRNEEAFALVSSIKSRDDAVEFLQRLIEVSGESQGEQSKVAKWARRTLALTLAESRASDNYARAQRLISRNLSHEPESQDDLVARAIVDAIYLGKSNPEKPLKQFEELLENYDWEPTLNEKFMMGQLYAADKQTKKASDLMMPLLLDEELCEPKYEQIYAKLLLDRGEPTEADLWVSRLVKQNVQDAATAKLLADIRFQRSQYDELLSNLTASSAASASRGQARETEWFVGATTLAKRYAMVAEYADQLEKQLRVVQNDGSSNGKLTNRLKTAAQRFRAAEESMADRLAKSDETPEVENALRLLQQGHCDQAAISLQKSAASASEEELVAFADAVFAGDVCSAKSLAAIESVYKPLLKQNSTDATIAVIVARLNEKRGDFERAISIYESILLDDPDQVVAINNLATLLGLTEKNAPLAVEICSKAIDKQGEKFFLLDTRGVSRLKAGDVDGAIRDFERAGELYPNAVTLFHLAWAAREKGMTNQARELADRAAGRGLTSGELHPLEQPIWESFQAPWDR
ncbi:tetratricopeptide repeat protein [Roseiconus nitratireducens]|uniref:Tetratricopeptide repeat protein n=1 Tax=Roseiconus nitratireducens TaxID=2605748 RepID=A0A5M6DFH2_9BACT|nr:tetratricopeptide repeat protein [Roseiconus nitratireducens]KAA5546248.1 tetratricopeptide repeat protein [Roseiconus nitratireducens]